MTEKPWNLIKLNVLASFPFLFSFNNDDDDDNRESRNWELYEAREKQAERGKAIKRIHNFHRNCFLFYQHKAYKPPEWMWKEKWKRKHIQRKFCEKVKGWLCVRVLIIFSFIIVCVNSGFHQHKIKFLPSQNTRPWEFSVSLTLSKNSQHRSSMRERIHSCTTPFHI